ncbi:hypothetical protein GBA63_14430 [Rubrobacter tropicus]|uniref:Uncharacterized protein n=1 Tax=Rubrobacter tropicus TaxID=2653851 RepID=A0A6G8QB83_9ACTN|nr:hypothetical protein [Rubrobacter tropicus]QIN83693.1 hypothetical protein GBA63_14430 [Rubrobacter tropicus]
MEQQKQLSLRDFYDSYQYNKTTLDKALTKLEEEAADINAQLEQRMAAQSRIATAQREISSLKGEKSDLFLEWQQAEFDDSQEVKKELKNKRRQIDERISELEENIREERSSMPAVDKTHAANLAVRKDMLKPLNVGAFMEKLKAMLDTDANDLNARIRAISVPSSAYKSDEYEAIRAGKDMSYAMQLSQHKRLAAKEAEKRKKMRPVSSTDEMHNIMSGRRKPNDDRMSVTSKGEKVKGYSERRVSNDEGDRSHVLSGDEVRAALAEKQAKKAS